MTSKRIVDLWLGRGLVAEGLNWEGVNGIYQILLVLPLSIHHKLVLEGALERQVKSGAVAASSPGVGSERLEWSDGCSHCLLIGTGCQLEKVPATHTSLSEFHSRLRVLVLSTLL